MSPSKSPDDPRGQSAKRFDIQVLRGIAVLAVVAFHADGDLFAKGFLGVDIFFVISGYLITGMILSRLEEGRFSFKEFFVRRARRLLPASLATLIGTSLLAAILLTPADYGEYAEQLFGALTFSANFFLARQTGYFAGSAETKLLLHIWSLSLEEQFYLVAPLLLWLTPLRARPWLLLAAMALSAALCFLLVSGPAVAGLTTKAAEKLAFFMLPPRAWELLIGSMTAYIMLRHPSLNINRSVKLFALLGVVAMCATGLSAVHPGADALVVTLATAVQLAGKDDWLRPNLPLRLVARVGDWSYSLYLVHWPLFALAFILWSGNPPLFILLGLSLLALLLGWSQYRFVELPFQAAGLHARNFRRLVIAGATGLGLATVSFAQLAASDDDGTQPAGLNAACDQRGGTFVQLPQCRTGPHPRVLLWGDSMAMHLVPGLRSELGGASFLQATKSACAPLLGLAHITPEYSRSWARECISFNDDVLTALADMPSVHNVVIASSWVQVFERHAFSLLIDGRVQPWSPVAGAQLVKTVRTVQAMGKRVILVGPTPIANHDVGACYRRLMADRPVFRPGGCDPTLGEIAANIGEVETELRSVADQTGAELILPTHVMCPEERCFGALDEQSMYRDRLHLTPAGSAHVVRSSRLRQLLN